MAASAKLKTGQWRMKRKSVTPPRWSRSTRLPVAPPSTNPSPASLSGGSRAVQPAAAASNVPAASYNATACRGDVLTRAPRRFRTSTKATHARGPAAPTAARCCRASCLLNRSNAAGRSRGGRQEQNQGPA